MVTGSIQSHVAVSHEIHVHGTVKAALAGSATDLAQASAAGVMKAQQMRRRDYSVALDPDRNEASWCGWHITLRNSAIWAHWHGSWWRLRGPDPVFHPY